MAYFNKSINQVASELKTDIENGLNLQEIINKREKYGFNELQANKKQNLFMKFLNQFKDFMIIVLIIAVFIVIIITA